MGRVTAIVDGVQQQSLTSEPMFICRPPRVRGQESSVDLAKCGGASRAFGASTRDRGLPCRLPCTFSLQVTYLRVEEVDHSAVVEFVGWKLSERGARLRR